jgi:6-phosphogluconolactonase
VRKNSLKHIANATVLTPEVIKEHNPIIFLIMKKYFFILFLFLAAICNTGCKKCEALLAGGFTTGNEMGLALFAFDPEEGSLKLTGEYDGGPSPTFFCFSKNRSRIYIIDEVMDFRGEKAGGITTMILGYKKSLVKESEMAVPFGGPCHISLSASGRYLFIASYSSSSVAVVKNGSMMIPEQVTDTIVYKTADSLASHPHMIKQDPLARHIYLTDLGLDRIMVYDLDTITGKLIRTPFQEVHVPRGSGPRHFVFNGGATRMYLINELGSTIMTFEVTADGSLKLLQTVRTTDESYTGKNQCAEITIGKDGRFLYASNRGENSIVVFKISNDGSLELAGRSTCGGDWPRDFIIDNSGKYLLSGNQKSNDISVFKINSNSGIPEGLVFKVPVKAPAYLEFLQ